MLKKLFFFFLLFFLNFSFVQAKVDPYCNKNINPYLSSKIENNKPQLIEVKVNKYLKWQQNNLKIIMEKKKILPPKFKKRFNAIINVQFDNKVNCSFKARIRQNGDNYDHIEFIDGNFFQSLDVELRNGHINGITKFKLLIPKTRYYPEDEIILTELLREFGFIAPRTAFVEVKLNNRTSTMLFQEKAEKEMLEYHARREGPMFEGDERYLVKLNLENRLTSKAVEFLLAKQTNPNWAIKDMQFQNISHLALTKLNGIYLNVIDQRQYNGLYNFTHFNFDNNSLAMGNQNQILEWDVYYAVMFSTSYGHGMSSHNRKFYWNSLENFFEPIFYDGNFRIDDNYPHMAMPATEYFLNGITEAKKRIKKIKIENFYEKLKMRGILLSKQEVQKKIDRIIENLNNLETLSTDKNKKLYLQPACEIDAKRCKDARLEDKVIDIRQRNISKSGDISTNDMMWNNYIDLSLKIDSNFNFVFRDPVNKSFKICKNKTLKCTETDLTNFEIRNLLRGRLVKNGQIYQYIGEYNGIENRLIVQRLDTLNEIKFKKIKFKDSNFYFDKDIKYDFDSEKNVLNIFQNKPGARAFFYKGTLKNIDINFDILNI